MTSRVIARRFRGSFLALGMILVMAGFLPGCGAPAGDDDGFPLTIAHRFGETRIPAVPERVLSLGRTDQDAILALGVVPVAVREFADNKSSVAAWPWTTTKLQGKQPAVLRQTDINPALIAGLRPDLIVAFSADLTREQYDWLSKIAPVITQPADSAEHGSSWREVTKTIGRALGKTAEATKLVEAVEAKISAVKSRYPGIEGKTVVLAQPGDSGHYVVWGSHDPRAWIFESLGMRLPAEIGNVVGNGPSATVGTERLGLLDSADAVVLLTSDTAQFEAFRSLPGYSALSVVQRKDVLVFDEDPSAALAFSSVLSLPPLLGILPEQLVSMVTK